MASTDFRPAKHCEFYAGGEGLIQDRRPILKKGLLDGSPDNPNNIAILVGPAEKGFVVNKCLVKLSSRHLEESIKRSSKSNEILKFPEIRPKDFQTVLECAIVGMEWKFMNLQETCRLIETADHFGFRNFIEDICCTVFGEAEANETVPGDKESLEVILFRSFGFERLRQKAMKYILENASWIFRGNNFLHLSLEDLGEILIQDKLKIESEVDVLNALIRWGLNALKNESKRSSSENLRDVLAEPLNWIRFPNIEDCEFRDYVIPLQILTARQISVLDLWYKNGGVISAFNNHPRDYIKTRYSNVATNDPKSMKKSLHATKMENLHTKFITSVRTHNLEIHIQNVEKQARNSQIQVYDMALENRELRCKVQKLDSVFEKWQKIEEANELCRGIEALKKYYDSSRIATIGNQNSGLDYDLLERVRRRIRGNLDISHLVAQIEEPEGIGSELLESDVETIEAKIVELKKTKYSEVYEPLSWRIFQKESDPTVLELQKFPNTHTYACAIIIKNNTSKTLRILQTYNPAGKVYIALPSTIHRSCTHNFGQTNSSNNFGLLSYDAGHMRIVIRYYFAHSYGITDFGIAITPLTFLTNQQSGFTAFNEDWRNDSTKIKALCEAPTEMEKCIKLENLCLHAELIGTGPKAILRVLVTDV